MMMRGDGAVLRVALVGCGAIGARRARILDDRTDTRLVLVIDRDLARARTIAETRGCQAGTDWHTAVSSEAVDAVIVSTSHDALAAIATEALRQGKHVLVEKPMGRTVEEAEAVLRQTALAGDRRVAADGRPQALKVGFNHRHHRAVQEAHAALRRGDIGEPFFARCRYGHGGRPGYETEWRASADIAGGGELLDQGMHALDLFRWFLGDFVEGLGFTSTFFWKPAGAASAAASVEDNAFALFRTEYGRIASLHVSWTQWRNLFSFEVFGREGYLTVDGLGGSYGVERLTWGRRAPASGPPDERIRDFAGADISWQREWDEFLAAIREERQPAGNGYDACEALKMARAIYRSQQTGAAVRWGPVSAVPP